MYLSQRETTTATAEDLNNKINNLTEYVEHRTNNDKIYLPFNAHECLAKLTI